MACRTIRMAGIVACAVLGTAHAAAQDPAGRASLRRWDDSLQQVTSAAALNRLAHGAHAGGGRVADLRKALFLIRSGDLHDDRPAIELALTNAQVIAHRTRWGWPDYVLARGFAVMAAHQWVETLSDGKRLAERHVDAVWRTLDAALARDSTLSSARRMLGRLTAAGGDRFLRPDQEVALRREARQPDADPDALLAWARHLRTLREYRAALAMLQRAASLGGDAGRLDLERARTLIALGDSAAATTAYWDGLEHLTSVAREMYRFDLAWITDSVTLDRFDALPDSSVTPWLRRFWNARDAGAAVHPGDRLREHLRRWVVAMERYRALSPWLDTFFSRVEMGFEYASGEAVPPPLPKQITCLKVDRSMFDQLWRMQPAHPGDLRAREPLLDHRGLVYLRHGEPQLRMTSGGAAGGGLLGGPIIFRVRGSHGGPARASDGTVLPWSSSGLGEAPAYPVGPTGESWIYGLDGTWHVVQFRGSQALGTYAATTLTQRTPDAWLDDPSAVSRIPGDAYVRLTHRIAKEDSSPMRRALRLALYPPTCYQETQVVAAQVRADEHLFLHRDTDTPPGLRPSNSVMQAFALGIGDDHTGEVLVSFAIASELLPADRDSSGGASYTVAFRLVAYDSARDRIVSLDSVRHVTAARPLGPHQFLTAHLELPLPAGTWNVSARAELSDGVVALQQSHAITVDSGTGVSLSDVVTGRPGSPGWLATDRDRFPLNYPNGWFSGEVADLYYEIRGVPAGAHYTTTIEMRELGASSPRVIEIQSSEVANGPVTYVRKSLGLDRLVPGRYRLTVTIATDSGRAVRQRAIDVMAGPNP